jgi:hypothetical protein
LGLGTAASAFIGERAVINDITGKRKITAKGITATTTLAHLFIDGSSFNRLAKQAGVLVRD